MTVREKFENLPKEAIDQLDYILNHFEKEVEYIIEEDSFLVLSCLVENNCPIIKCSPNYSPSIGDIIHEIWHLFIKSVLKINTFDVTHELAEIMIEISETKDDCVSLFIYLQSAVEHYYFLKVIDPKHLPYFFIERDLKEFLATSKMDLTRPQIMNLAIDYVQLYILKEGINKGKVELEHLKSISSEAFELGSKLIEILKEFKTIEDEFEVMRKTISVLWNIELELNEFANREYVFKIKNL